MIVRAEISHNWPITESKPTEEALAPLKELMPSFNLSTYGDGFYSYSNEEVVDLDLLFAVCAPFKIEPRIRPFKGHNILAKGKDFGAKIKSLEDDVRMIRQSMADGDTVVSVHVPNFSLLQFNEVDVLEDFCTDALQKKLNEGWRMLCICPPLNERRPTYIIGRFCDPTEQTSISRRCI